MTTLRIEGLEAEIAGRKILHGIDLEVRSGEVHAVMGPNGAGKSTLSNVLMGHPSYRVTSGSITLGGTELVGLPPHERAVAGLFLALQDPIEVPGVRLIDLVDASITLEEMPIVERHARLAEEAERIGLPLELLTRSLNADASGGQKKRLETLQLAMFRPRIAVLDELDSGLDVDALREITQRVRDEVVAPAPDHEPLGVLAITHYSRIFSVLRPEVVHVLVGGRIVESGDADLAGELEATGYARFAEAGAAPSIFEV